MHLSHTVRAIKTHMVKKTRRERCLRRREEEEEWKGLEGLDPCIVSLHAPVPAVIPALCLSLSTGDVWLLGTAARGWKLKGQRIFRTTALQWVAIQEKIALLYSFNRRQAQFVLSRSGTADGQRDGWMSHQAMMEEILILVSMQKCKYTPSQVKALISKS